jgi:putative CocE/NonD family hydrolase
MPRCNLVLIVCAVFFARAASAQEAIPTEDEFIEVIRAQGVAEAVGVFQSVRGREPDAVVFSEGAMNRLGYEYVNEGRVEEAIEIFKLNVMAYPDASNTYDSLGEAYMMHGDIEQAIANYKKSVELNPENVNGSRYAFALENYVKYEYHIPMRDGVRLYTQVYVPRDRSRDYPILFKRTPYGVGSYGPHNYNNYLGPSESVARDIYIFVYQDVRGRYMSEGLYDNMRPHVPGDSEIDESSDTYDTIEWLLENVEGHNGKVGMWGTSYPGFYVTAALPEAHPALVASLPQAPISDFFFDDFHHHGAFILTYWLFMPITGYQKDSLTTRDWFQMVRSHTADGYKFFMDLGPLKNTSEYYGEDNFLWWQVAAHPNYDEFWQARNILPHLKDVDHAVMTVGGWFDAEDLYGPLNIYRTLERENPGSFNVLVMGPWAHGGWGYDRSPHMVGNLYFGDNISGWYQREVEAPFFRYFLKGEGEPPSYEALTFDTGRNEWLEFDVWPPAEVEPARLYFQGGKVLSSDPPVRGVAEYTEYVSDPNEPVPYTDATRIRGTPRYYMSEDQRFAGRRPDVIEFQTEVLEEDVTLAGDIIASLKVSTTGTAADWVVKLIDVYPDDEPNNEHTPGHIRLGGYQQMVRSEVIRGRFRNSYEHPEPFVPGEVTEVTLPLQDVLHTFKAGHRIMVQVQSTWFPLVDRNPQKYVDNIFEADEEDFIKATHRVYHSPEHASYLEVKVLR